MSSLCTGRKYVCRKNVPVPWHIPTVLPQTTWVIHNSHFKAVNMFVIYTEPKLTRGIGSIWRHAFTCDVTLLTGITGHLPHDCSTIFWQTLSARRLLQRRLAFVGSQRTMRAKIISAISQIKSVKNGSNFALYKNKIYFTFWKLEALNIIKETHQLVVFYQLS